MLMLAHAQSWGNIDYNGKPWVSNVSAPNKVTRGLQNRHLSLWASHGRYYSRRDSSWQWQRPNLFTTREDLFTQTIVVPFLIPMLENAGAVVFTPRERDWQRHEVIVDNDDHQRLINYMETGFRKPWQQAPLPGFAQHGGPIPTARTPLRPVRHAWPRPQPARRNTVLSPTSPIFLRRTLCRLCQLPDDGQQRRRCPLHRVAQRTADGVPRQPADGRFHVGLSGHLPFRQGMFAVQPRGADQSEQSSRRGDGRCRALWRRHGQHRAWRTDVSGLPRALEGARYWAQWAGMPYSVYSSKYGQNDYGDDINVRS